MAFGWFQNFLSDFPADTLYETIPHFHDTIDRYCQLKESIAADAVGRAASVKAEIDFLLKKEALSGTLQRMLESGQLPLRVTHNDTKLNNVLGWINELAFAPVDLQEDPRAQAIFETIGAYLAYTTIQYAHFYDLQHLMMLGRVMSGKGGDTILRTCQQILADEFPEVYKTIRVMLPDEKTRRVGQSVAATSLPERKA